MRTQPCDTVTKKKKKKKKKGKKKDNSCARVLVAGCYFSMVYGSCYFQHSMYIFCSPVLTHCYILVNKIHWLNDTLLYFS